MGLTVILRGGGARTDIVSVSDIASLAGREEGSCALVARDLCGRGFTSWELEEITGVWWIVEVAVEPPFGKVVIQQRRDRSIVVREGLGGDVKAIHARVEDGRVGVHPASGEQRKERKSRECDHIRKSNTPKKKKVEDTSSVRERKRKRKKGRGEEKMNIEPFLFYFSLSAPTRDKS